MEILLNDEPSYENLIVIPIVGMGGIGKTTLAQCVYNDEQQLKGHFDLKAWVCVSDVFDVERVTTDILNSFIKGHLIVDNLNEAQEELVNVLKDKKILLVLDDIWFENYNDWNQLQTPFRQGLRGSRVIVTTRKDMCAKMVISNPSRNTTIYLKGLSDDDCWCIFKQHINDCSDLVEMRDDIIRKCKGLPLAAKALGGLLKSTVEKRQRRNILQSSIWSEKSHVLPVLRLSYHHLPSDLKLCFAYCSIFPKDYEFDEMEVVLLWMAQGFIPENNKERMEDIGLDYFFDLVSRSLFEECSSDRGGSRKFIMHDLIHDLAEWAAGGMCCVMGTMNPYNNLVKRRHLFLHKNGIADFLQDRTCPSRLRTFLYPSYGPVYIPSLQSATLIYVEGLTYIRALRLSLNSVWEVPESIGDMIHLRLLILHIRRIEVLPKSISKLYNLQTLELHSCHELHRLPNFTFLVKLRHLYIERSTSLQEMPLGMSRLKSLQTLNKFILAVGGGSRVSELGNLLHLNGKLSISGIENVTSFEDAHKAQLHEKKSLDKLHLEWGSCSNEVDDNTKKQVLEHLKPHTSIKECNLEGYRGLTFPIWLGDPSFSNMVNIQLMDCRECESLPPLGQLPLLKNLIVRRMDGIKQVGLEFFGRIGCSIPFPALETLCFYQLKSWGKWLHLPIEDNKSFPCLKKLSIHSCFSLQDDLPPNLPSLEKLEIKKCTKLSITLPSIPLLEILEVDGCKVLSTTKDVEFCSKRMILRNISEMVDFTGCFPYLLEELVISNCPRIDCSLGGLPNNQTFHHIQGVNIEQSVEEWGLHLLNSLQSLYLENVGSSAECVLCLDLSLPSSLSQLSIKGFQNLKYISCSSISPNLKTLQVTDCPKLEYMVGNFTLLTDLLLDSSPIIFHYLGDSRTSSISCIGDFTLLTRLSICDITNMNKSIREWGLHLLTSLHYLTLHNVGNSIDTVECIPGPDLSLPSSLCSLDIKDFTNLKSICGSSFPNLTKISIQSCPKFESFGKKGIPPRLIKVYIYDSDLIEQHLKSKLEYDRINITIGSEYCAPMSDSNYEMSESDYEI